MMLESLACRSWYVTFLEERLQAKKSFQKCFPNFFILLTPEKDRLKSFLKNVTPRSARNVKSREEIDLSKRVIMMDIEEVQPSMEEVRRTIEERQKKLSDFIESRRFDRVRRSATRSL
jgi:hypothetical protein